jgi:hypothetical protein
VRQHHVRAGLGSDEQQQPQRLRRAGDGDHLQRRDAGHLGDRLAQRRRAGGRPVRHADVAESLEHLGRKLRQQLVPGPPWSGARGQVELDRRGCELVLGEPPLEEEGCDPHPPSVAAPLAGDRFDIG